MFFEYYFILISIFIIFIIALLVFYLSYFLVNKNFDLEKNSPYECGFDPFEDARSTFDVKFYLVAVLFIIFDLEIVFLFPWAVAFVNLSYFGFWCMFFFLSLLTIGFIYEWKKGAIDWN
jgi:NADH-quinone oxidoreductase subunit A